MAELNFPDPAVTNPWTDQNDQIWAHDADGWSRVISRRVTGYKNVLINPRLNIDQRGVYLGDWANVPDGDFGPDRWFSLAGEMAQKVENGNMKTDEDYVLSWDGGGDGTFNSADGSLVGSSPLLIQKNIIGTNVQINLPFDSTSPQLELGTEQTFFEIRPIGLELLLCLRYYFKPTSLIIRINARAINYSSYLFFMFQTEMRTAPIVNYDVIEGGGSSWDELVGSPSIAGIDFSVKILSEPSASSRIQFEQLTADAEL